MTRAIAPESAAQRRRGHEFAQSTARRADGLRSRTDHSGAERRVKRIGKADGSSMPVSAVEPKRPPIGVLYEDLAGDLRPKPRYGQYPRGFLAKIAPLILAPRERVLHVCSGCLPRGEGIRVDIDPGAHPDVLADGRRLPFADGSIAAVVLDPPYTPHYARTLYGVDYPRPAHLLREAVRVVRPGGRVIFVHYITPKPPVGARFVCAFALSTGFDMPVRAVTVFERDEASLPFGGSA